MTKIATLSENDLYRIGDCIFARDPTLYTKIIKNKDKFNNTFLYEFSTRWQKQVIYPKFNTMPHVLRNNERVQLAANVVADFIKTRRFKLPPRDALVIHLRLGDSLMPDATNTSAYLCTQEDILNEINKYSLQKQNRNSTDPY